MDERFASSLAFGGTECYVSWAMIQVVGSGTTSACGSSFSASVWITGFTYVNSKTIVPRTPAWVSLSVKRRQEQCLRWIVVTLFVVSVHFLSPLVVPVTYLTVDDEDTVTMNNVSYDVLWGMEGPLARGN